MIKLKMNLRPLFFCSISLRVQCRHSFGMLQFLSSSDCYVRKIPFCLLSLDAD